MGMEMTKNYTAIDLQKIAKIDEDQHLWLLTDCGIHRDFARKIIGLSDTELTAAVAQYEPMENKTAMQAGLVAAAKREIIIREGR
jgi:hypothetical protein